MLASIVWVAASAAGAADVSFYLVAKGQVFTQTASGPPVLKLNPARFSSLVGLAATNAVTNATVQALPGGPANALALQAGGSGTIGTRDQFTFSAKYATISALDAAYPDGNYKCVIQAAHDGMQTATLALNGDTYPASDPYIINFTAAQTIDPAAGFTLTWPPFSGGTANDFILVSISDSLAFVRFSTPDPGQPGSLNGTATSLVIPANTLPGGALLTGTLLFIKVAARDPTSYPGVLGFAAYYKQTQFNLGTVAAPAPPRLDVSRTNAVGPVQLLLSGQAGQRYAIDASTNLPAGPWLALFTNTANGGQFIFIDTQFASMPSRFYRARDVP